MLHRTLCEIYQDTLVLGAEVSKKRTPSEKIRIASLRMPSPAPWSSTLTHPFAEVFDEDVITTILRTDPTQRTLVLNCASPHEFGGGVMRGAMAQEEELFRKTDYGLFRGQHLYPLQPLEMVVTRGVTVLKGADYQPLTQPLRTVDMVAVAAPYFAENRHRLSSVEQDRIRKNIEGVIAFAVAGGYENVVLAALGCGVFRNPPEFVADQFRQVLQQTRGHFRRVLFAILSQGRNANFQTFSQRLR